MTSCYLAEEIYCGNGLIIFNKRKENAKGAKMQRIAISFASLHLLYFLCVEKNI
jgi:hypothetical protein